MPGLITDLVLSLDDRWLYFSNWLHGDIRRYDVSDPAHPKLTAQAGAAACWARRSGKAAPQRRAANAAAQPRRQRLYVTNSLYSTWDNQFYPDLAEGRLVSVAVRLRRGRRADDQSNLLRRLRQRTDGPVRAHEIRFPGGDCTSDIWV